MRCAHALCLTATVASATLAEMQATPKQFLSIGYLSKAVKFQKSVQLMSDIAIRYRNTYEEFSSLLSYAVTLLEMQTGYETTSSREYYAERIFNKLVCHGLTLKQLSPSPPPADKVEFWDISSSYAIARTLIESYEALAYIALEPIPDEERTFRILLWELHADERRQRMLELIGANDPQVANVIANVQRLRREILANPLLSTLNSKIVSEIKRGETPPYHLSNSERDKRNSINNDYHRVVTMHLSSHIHTHPFSVQQLFQFRAGDDDCLQLMSIPLQYSSGFIAKSISGMTTLFTPRIPKQSHALLNTLDQWNLFHMQGQ